VEQLEKLQSQLKEVDHRQREDSELVKKTLSDLRKVMTTPPPPAATPKVEKKTVVPPLNADKGYEYTIQKGDNSLAIVVKAWNDHLKEEGKKGRVTIDQVLALNPTLKPSAMRLGQKIMLPIPNN
jgi:hypothetical protein